MNHRSLLICALFFFLLFQSPNNGLSSGQGQTPEPILITLDSVIATQAGIRMLITGHNTQYLSFQIDKWDKGTGSYPKMMYLEWYAPNQLTHDDDQTAQVILPVIVDPEGSYKIWAWASQTEKNANWIPAPVARPFSGFSPQITDSIDLQFASDKLTISARTKVAAILKAGWNASGATDNSKIKMEASGPEAEKNPQLPLSFSALGQTVGKQGPALCISLEDPEHGIVQQAQVSLSINLGDENLKKDLKDAISQPGSSTTNKPGSSTTGKPDTSAAQKKKFPWGDLLKTGIGAILKYFVI